MTITPSDAEVIADAIESALLDVHVGLPGKVQTYNSATQTATVELQVKRALPTDDPTTPYTTEDLPVLENIPVQFPRTNSFALTFPLAAGDTGLVVFSEVSIDQWRSKGLNTTPGDIGRHTLTGGVFQPGLVPVARAITDIIGSDLVLGKIGGAQVRVKTGGTIEAVSSAGPTADDFVAMAGKVLTELNKIATALSSHTHTGVTTGSGTSGTPLTPPYTANAVASSNLKADN